MQVDIFKVVGSNPVDAEEMTVALCAFCGNRNFFLAGQILSGSGFEFSKHVQRFLRPPRDRRVRRRRVHIDQIIGSADGVFVVTRPQSPYYPDITQAVWERFQQTIIIALMQSDRKARQARMTPVNPEPICEARRFAALRRRTGVPLIAGTGTDIPARHCSKS